MERQLQQTQPAIGGIECHKSQPVDVDKALGSHEITSSASWGGLGLEVVGSWNIDALMIGGRNLPRACCELRGVD